MAKRELYVTSVGALEPRDSMEYCEIHELLEDAKEEAKDTITEGAGDDGIYIYKLVPVLRVTGIEQKPSFVEEEL